MRYTFLIFLILFCSCNNSPKKQSGRFDNISPSDTTCIKAIKKAKADVAKGKLVYYYHAGGLIYNPLRCENELDSLFNQFNIELASYVTSDLIIPGRTQGCYEDYVNESLANHFGKKFIDSLMYLADSLYVLKKINTFFENHECDTEPLLPGGLQITFDKKIKYPNGYVRKKKADDMAFANFNLEIDRSGKAKIIQSYFVFTDTKNHKFENELRAVFEPILLNTKWNPATIKRQNVNSTFVTFIYFK